MIMKYQKGQKFVIIQACISLVLLASVDGVSHWPTPEFFDHHYHNVAPSPSEEISKFVQSPNIGNSSPGSNAATVGVISSKNPAQAKCEFTPHSTPPKRHFQYAALKMPPHFSPQYEPTSTYTHMPYALRPQQYLLMFDESRPRHQPMITLHDANTLGNRKSLKPRWANHRRLSAREAVAVIEKELQLREAAKSNSGSIKNVDDIQAAATNMASYGIVAAPTNRRSGHHMGVTGPVHTFVKTDKHGHYKWGVRHHAGHGFSR